jgi:four helix bundle protein
MKFTSFKDLEVWKLSIQITQLIFTLTKKRNFSRDYTLKGQIKRSMISVSSNIAEGFERSNNNEFIRFLKIAKGSVGEARSQLYISLIEEYIKPDEYSAAEEQLVLLGKQIGGFIRYLEQSRKSNIYYNKSVNS